MKNDEDYEEDFYRFLQISIDFTSALTRKRGRILNFWFYWKVPKKN